MSDFFLYRSELPMESGFSLFGLCHMTWLISIVAGSWLFGRFYTCADDKVKGKCRIVLGIVFPVMGLSRDLYLIGIGHFEAVEYPLHLCNMSLWIGAIYLWTRNRFAGVVYVLLCVPAAASALLFPGWSVYPFANYMHIHSFVYHWLIVAYGWCLVRGGEILPEWKELWKPFVFGVTGYVVLFQVNRLFNTNFWFINIPSYGSPLVLLYELLGDRWYLVGHFLFCASVVVLWQLILRRIVTVR